MKNQPPKFILYSLSLFILFFSSNLSAQQEFHGANELHAQFKGQTKALRDLAPQPAMAPAKRTQRKANKPHFSPPNFINYEPLRGLKNNLPNGEDPVRQKSFGTKADDPILPELVLEGIGEATTEIGVPDTNGDVGPNHYVQIVNASWFQIFAKDGTPLTDAISTNTLWSQIGKMSFGDPNIHYDQEADRWLLTDLANFSEVMFAVSVTNDPMGEWNLYSLVTPGFADYPKFGIWPSAYIFTINEAQGDFYPVYALNRQKLLAGAPELNTQRIAIPAVQGGFLSATPMDWNSPAPPPTDDIFVARLVDDVWGNGNTNDELEIWTITLDWDNPANTTFSGQKIEPAAFDTDGCAEDAGGGGCIPQPGTDNFIDGIMTIIMNNICYWNFGTHESAVLTFSVNAGDNIAGVRWMELRRMPGEDWAIHQEGTVAPADGLFRFIGGIAINGKGDIGLAYSVSGTTHFPSLRYTGRIESDPLGQMTIDEYEFATGTGSLNSTSRYGDYARMTVDPINNSFWFTSEYVLENGLYGTKIVNFLPRRDAFDLACTKIINPKNDSQLGDEVVTIEVKNTGNNTAENFSVGYIFENGTPVIEAANIAALPRDSNYQHTFASTVEFSNLGGYQFKVFSQYDADENLLNDTLQRSITQLPQFDIGVLSIIGLDDIICESEVISILVVENFGTEEINSFTLDYSINGQPTQSIIYNSTIPALGMNTMSLPLTGLINGENTLSLSTRMPNTMADEVIENDDLELSFMVSLEGLGVNLQLEFDFYPTEITWELFNENGEVILSDGPFSTPFGIENYTWCLSENTCYTFVIYDSYGDGLASPSGDYSITDGDGNELAALMEINFGDSESAEFCLGNPCAVAAEAAITNETIAGAEDGAILVSVTNGVAPFLYALDPGFGSQSEPLFENLPGGDYIVVIEDANGCLEALNVTVETTVAVPTPPNTITTSASPNPSANGAFEITVNGLINFQRPLDLQIFNVKGQVVSYATIPSVDKVHRGMISLANFPAGVYYVRCLDENINSLIRLVRL